MGEFLTPAILNEQVLPDEIGQTGAMFQPIMARDRPAWGKLGAREEIPELFKGCPVLQRDAHQAGNDVVECDGLGGAVRAFDAKEDFGRGLIIVDRDIQGASANPDLLDDVVTTSGEGQASTHDLSPSFPSEGEP